MVIGPATDVFMGLQADVLPLRPPSARHIAPYQQLKVGQVTTDVGAICPPDVVQEVRSALVEAFADDLDNQFSGSEPVLVADVICRFYKKKSLVGREGRLDLLVHLRDGPGGAEVGRVYVEGVTESPLQYGADDMAGKCAEKLCDYLVKLKKQGGRGR